MLRKALLSNYVIHSLMKRLIAIRVDEVLEKKILDCAASRFEGNISMVLRAALKKYLEAC